MQAVSGQMKLEDGAMTVVGVEVFPTKKQFEISPHIEWRSPMAD
jgi:hypothetical protein